MLNLPKSAPTFFPICSLGVSLALLAASSSCVKRAHNSIPALLQQANQMQPKSVPSLSPSQKLPPRININTAPAKELETLPGIGKGLAERIIEHREKYGAFRRPEHLIIVRGISDRKFRAVRDLITVE